MAATLMDGRAVAATVRAEVATGVEECVREHGRPPGLATVLTGDDPASAVYVRMKHKACEEVGIASFHEALPADVSQERLLPVVERLAADDSVDGILVQLPLPGD